MQRVTHKALFLRYQDQTVITKCKLYAHWTLPQLMADPLTLSNKNTSTLERDYQEIGALLVNNLAAKLAGLLFPSSRPFFGIELSPALRKQATEQGATAAELQSGLSRLELKASKQLLLNGSYEQLIMILKHLVVTGNTLMYRDSSSRKTHAYGVQAYGVRRDGRGNVMDIVLREYTDFEALPADVQQALSIRSRGRYKKENEGNNRVELYTRIQRQMLNSRVVYRVSQEADDMPVGTPGVYPEHLCPWQAVTWSLVTGESYGRGLVEDYAGGFAKLSDLSHAATLYGIAMSKLLNLVAMGLGADIDEMEAAETGQYVQGAKDAVTTYESGDAKKLQQLEANIEATAGRLSRAFMYKGNTRNAERVTAFELKQDALEAETTLGGAYSSLSASMQIPLAHILLTEVDSGMLEGIVNAQIELDITAGIPALGRQSDVQNIAAAAQDAAAIVPVLTQLDKRVDADKLLDVVYGGQSVDSSVFFKSEERMQQEAKAEAQAAQGQQQIQAATTLADQAEQLQTIQG